MVLALKQVLLLEVLAVGLNCCPSVQVMPPLPLQIGAALLSQGFALLACTSGTLEEINTTIKFSHHEKQITVQFLRNVPR